MAIEKIVNKIPWVFVTVKVNSLDMKCQTAQIGGAVEYVLIGK